MAKNRTATTTRLRRAAVAFVLVAGAGATLATTPPLERCPHPPGEGEVSDFYGDQEYETGMSRLATPSAFVGGGFAFSRTYVTAGDCLTADDVTIPVSVHFGLSGERVGAVPDETLRTLTVSDGLGRSWSPDEVHAREWLPPTSDGGDPYPAYASVQFQLPVDLAYPVSLHLGQLRSSTLEELSLDEPRPTENES